ncbi:MAG TPA: RodZ domain-containing protein [Candidatus Dormibacteraeota bacterium]|nr:RodZ domain-containing protein [Candidatus Dormibacteraeota bacterium]
MGEFGDKFRKAREKRELSLDDVSNVTKIGSRMLQAIEEENFDQLPGGVFNKGFIRAYAKHLGLDSEEAVTDYLACLRQAQIDSHAGWDTEKRTDPRPGVAANSAAAPDKPAAKVQTPIHVEELPDLQLPRAEHVRAARKDYVASSSSGIPWKFVAVAAVILIATVLLWNRHSRSVHTVSAKANAPVSTAPATPAQAPVNPPQLKPVATASASPHPSTTNPQPSQPAPPVASHAPTTAPATPASIEEKNDVTIRSFGDPISKTSEKPAATLTLVIRATENSWISVSADGQLVTQETLIAPAHTVVHAHNEVVARIGNAAGVTFLLNGAELPAQGAEGEVKTFTFDSQGMHVAPPPQTP